MDDSIKLDHVVFYNWDLLYYKQTEDMLASAVCVLCGILTPG